MNAHIWQQPPLCAQSGTTIRFPHVFQIGVFIAGNTRRRPFANDGRLALGCKSRALSACNASAHPGLFGLAPEAKEERVVCRSCGARARGIACQFISRRPPTPCLPGAPRYCFLAQENRARAPSQSSSRSSPRRGSQRGRSRFIEEVRRLKFWLSMQPRRKASRALLLLECRSFFPSFYLSSSNTRRLSHTRPRPTVAKMFSLPLDR